MPHTPPSSQQTPSLGRLSRGPQPVPLADGSTTGPITQLIPLHPLRGSKGPPGTSPGGGPTDTDVARAFFFQEGPPAGALDGLFVLAALKGVFVCRVLPDQRVQYLHTVMPPVGIREDAPPYVAWRVVHHDANGR